MAKTKKRGGTPVNIALDASKQKEFNQKVNEVKSKKKVRDEEELTGVVYMSHLPWGFEEQPLREYLRQFGKIRKLRVSRSKKTGNSKGYAYIQFKHDEVAKIVAETMNNYLMFGKLIKCKYLEKPHPATFKHANRQFVAPAAQDHSIKKHNQPKTEKTLNRNKRKMMSKYRKKMAELAEGGISFNLEELGIPTPAAAEVKSPRKRKASGEWTEMAGAKTPKLEDAASKSQSKTLKSKKTPKRQSLLPQTVDTPKGTMNVLVEDSSEDEISFKTPPQAIKSSRLSSVMSVADPTATQKLGSSQKQAKAVDKTEKTSKSAKKVKTQKVAKTPKSSQKQGKTVVAKTPNSAKKEKVVTKTPNSNKKELVKTPKSGLKAMAKKSLKTPPSSKKRKH